MPTYTTISSVQATTKVLDLWNGTSNDTPPTGWDEPAFDDSGWATAQAEGGAAPQSITPWAGFIPPDLSAGFLARAHFSVPTDYEFYKNVDIGSGLVGPTTFINGHQYLQTGWRLIIENEWIDTEGDNVIAFGANAAGASGYWIEDGQASVGWQWWFYIRDLGNAPYAWGTVEEDINDRGVLGTGDAISHLTPTLVDLTNFPNPLAPDVVKIASNGKTTLFLCSGGEVLACGDNENGMMGLGSSDTDPHLTPVQIITSGPGYAIDVAVGGDCCIVFDRDGQTYLWGTNAFGTVGDGTTDPHPTHRIISGGAGLAFFGTRYAIAGKNHAFLRSAGAQAGFSAGANDKGQLGLGHTTSPVTTYAPISLPSGTTVTIDAVCGDEQTLVTMDDGNVYGCGYADYGSLGVLTGNVDTLDSTAMTGVPIEQAGAITFELVNLGTIDQTFVRGSGDENPYGGLGNDDGSISSNVVRAHPVAGGPSFTDLRWMEGAPVFAGGVVNQWAEDDSKVTFGAIALDHTLIVGADEEVTGQALDTGTLTNLWESNGDVYVLPAGTVWAKFVVQNIAGGGLNGTVTINADWYSDASTLVSTSTGGGTATGVTNTRVFESPVVNPYGVVVYLTHATSRSNTVNVTFEAMTSESAISKLYTWGYGGYGQMGSGADADTNAYAISLNGLSDIYSATFAERVAFAIPANVDVVALTTSPTWVQILG